MWYRNAASPPLFAAVMMRNVEDKMAQFQTYSPSGASLEERLTDAGCALLRRVLVRDTIGLVRLSIAEARRFPDLASSAGRMARERGADAVAQLLAEVARSDDWVGGGPRPGVASHHGALVAGFDFCCHCSCQCCRDRNWTSCGRSLNRSRAQRCVFPCRLPAHGGNEWPNGRS